MLNTKTIRRTALTLGATGALLLASSAAANGNATITISHQTRGCHAWQINAGPIRASLSMTVKAGTTLRFVNNDIMPQKLMQTKGVKLHLVRAGMNHMSASTSVKLLQKGLYRFTTRAGEDYKSMAMMKTTGEDYVLRLTVRVK
jgi:plastocyanin